jgi:hypothetical protein
MERFPTPYPSATDSMVFPTRAERLCLVVQITGATATTLDRIILGSSLRSFPILRHDSANGFQKVGARLGVGDFDQLAWSLGVGLQRHTVKFLRRSHSSSPASITANSDGRLGLASGFRKSRLRIFTDWGTVDSVSRASPGFVGALLGRSHGICDPLLAFRSWRKRRSQTGKCPADGLADHGALRVCVGIVSLGLYAQLAILYVYTVLWRVHYGRENASSETAPVLHVAPRESASIHYALKRVLMGIREARRIIRSLWHQQRESGALESVERVQHEEDAFVRRED